MCHREIIRIADFFCGVGGIRLGFEQASDRFDCVFSNDIDKYAVKTYETNFPQHKVDTRSISEIAENPESIPDFDIFLGGFPCQSFSVAGNLKGLSDSRGNLFFDIVKILKAKQPKAFLLENVKNLKSHDKGRTYRIIRKELWNAGYIFQSKIMNSCKYGNTPQNRERIFLVGFLDRESCRQFRFPSEKKLDKNVSALLEETPLEKYYYKENCTIYPVLLESIPLSSGPNQVYQYRRYYVRANKSGLCPTLTANMGTGGHNVGIIRDDRGIRKLTPRECFNLQTFPVDFILPAIADSHLYKQAGNTVTVEVIRRIAMRLAVL